MVVKKQHNFSNEEVQEFRATFDRVDKDRNGSITQEELGSMMKDLGEPVPAYKLRQMVQEVDKDGNSTVEFDEFLYMMAEVRDGKSNVSFHNAVQKADKINRLGGTSAISAAGTTHSFSDDEKEAFVDWINWVLDKDDYLNKNKVLPLKESDNSLYQSMHDGILLIKLINSSVADTVDERAVNMTKLNVYRIHENQTLAINSAKSIGCAVINVGAQDMMDGTQHLVLGLVWQIIRIGLFARINLQNCPGLVRLLEGDETLEDLLALPPDQILLRWMNYHLNEAGSNKRVHNFSGDIKDSEAYTILLKQIAPPSLNIDTSPLQISDTTKRAEAMLNNAEKMNCRKFVRPRDVVKGNAKLNMAFVAHLFNTHPGLEPMEEVVIEVIEETREEKTYRNWMNSLEVKPFVNSLYQDLRDGIILLQLFDKVTPGCVNWKQVNTPPFKKIGGNMKKLENCGYALQLGKEHKFSLVGISGSDIFDGNKTLTLAVVWQLMRAYTLSVLSKLGGGSAVSDSDIINWANNLLASSGKNSQMRDFKDRSLANSHCIIDIVDSIRPNSIDYSIVLPANIKEEKDLMDNARYAISMGRKIGAGIYALPEDVVEGKHKLIMTIFACLWAASYDQGAK